MSIPLRVCVDHLWVERFDELDVARSLLWVGIRLVLDQDLLHWPSLILAKTRHHTSSAVLALIAVDVHWLIGGFLCKDDRVANGFVFHLSAVLVCSNAEVVTLDALHVHEPVEVLAWLRVHQRAA